MKHVLIYSPANLRAVDQQSQAELLIRQGHKVFLLTWAPRGVLHENFEKLGAEAHSVSGVGGRSVIFFINQARYLVKFCKKHRIDIILAHLQSNAVVAGLAKPFIKAETFYFRHNSDYVSLMPSRKNKWLNKLANRLSPKIVAIAPKVKEQLLKEGVRENRILRINLCYNFDYYLETSLQAAPGIREKYKCNLLLISVARLDPMKRHLLAFEAVRQVAEAGADIKLVCIGEGPMFGELTDWIQQHKMSARIFLAGFVTNTIDYFEAADLLLHLSYSEASSHVVKEAGMCHTAVIACEGVGDFDDYLQPNINAILVDKESPVPQVASALLKFNAEKSQLKTMGDRLHDDVMKNFSMDAVAEQYKTILTNNTD